VGEVSVWSSKETPAAAYHKDGGTMLVSTRPKSEVRLRTGKKAIINYK
jgi:hypothetical protein